MKRRSLPPVREETPPKNWNAFCDNDWAVNAVVAFIGTLCYINSLHGDFVHDDIPAIVANSDVNGGNSVWKAFGNDFWGTPMSDVSSHKSYRPLTTLSFRLNYTLCGLSSWGWHLVNVLLHATSCVLVARVSMLVARLTRPFAALSALLFAVHPIHTEAVAGVVGRADILACIFFLSSVLLYHGSTQRHKVWPSIAVAGLGMLAKETGLTALLFNICFDVYRSWSSVAKSSATKWRWKSAPAIRILKVLASSTILLGARLALLQGSFPAFSPQDNPPAFHPCFSVRLLTFCYLAVFNWWLLLCPWSLSHDWQMGSIPLITSVWDPRNLVTGLAVVVLVALGRRVLMDFEVQRHPPVVAGFLLLVIPYLPASNVLVTVGFVVAERVLYIPSVGSVILTCYGVQLLWRHKTCWRRVLVLGVMVLAGSGAARTYMRNRDWRTKETLLRADLAVLPHNAKLHYNFGNFLKDIEQQENAIKHYKEALRLWPSYSSAHNNLGTLVVASGQAEHHFLLALKYNKDHINAHYNLGKLYKKKHRIQDSMAMLERCILLAPKFVPAHVELLQLTPTSRRGALLNTVLALEPGRWEHRAMYGDWLRDRGLKPQSIKHYLEAMRLAFKNVNSREDLTTLRMTCLVLRDLGQQARILQLITRWHAAMAGPRVPAARNLHLREWKLRTELADRAQLYIRHYDRNMMSTCVHHSQLEVATNVITIETQKSASRKSSNNIKAVKTLDTCRKNKDLEDAKKVSLTNQFKPINKSEIGHKVNSCPLNKKKDNPKEFTFLSDHFVKTY